MKIKVRIMLSFVPIYSPFIVFEEEDYVPGYETLHYDANSDIYEVYFIDEDEISDNSPVEYETPSSEDVSDKEADEEVAPFEAADETLTDLETAVPIQEHVLEACDSIGVALRGVLAEARGEVEDNDLAEFPVKVLRRKLWEMDEYDLDETFAGEEDSLAVAVKTPHPIMTWIDAEESSEEEDEVDRVIAYDDEDLYDRGPSQ
jgi:hypothetical protein